MKCDVAEKTQNPKILTPNPLPCFLEKGDLRQRELPATYYTHTIHPKYSSHGVQEASPHHALPTSITILPTPVLLTKEDRLEVRGKHILLPLWLHSSVVGRLHFLCLHLK